MHLYDLDKSISTKWKVVPLGTIAQFRNGLNYTRENFGRGLKVINVKDFQNHLIASFDNLDEINPDGIVREESFLREGDIVFVRSNGNRELIGRSLFIEKINKPVSHSAFTIKLRFTSNNAFPKFYAYLFRSSLIRQTLASQGNGTNISNLNQDILSNLKVPFPPVGTQRHIAAILSAYDDLTENNTRRIRVLEEMARRIYEEWFVLFRFPGYEKAKMIKTDREILPEKWSIKSVSDFGKVVTGKTPSKSDHENFGFDVPFLKLPDMHGRIFCIDTSEKLSNKGANSQSSKYLPANSLCVSCIGTAGIVNINAVECQTNQQINSLIPDRLRDREFLYFALIGLRELINRYGANGATMVNLNKAKFESLPITYPEEKIVKNYHQVTHPLFEQILNLQKKNEVLRSTRDLLLPKLISGEIDISNFPEPLSD